ncbi:MAG: M20/M25/M40 family metallo-hydrolase, partial [Chloroflexi bacterium]|nr:M20/M25/M40 family metallo-hydrolase [Chloroflexota bacterium]
RQQVMAIYQTLGLEVRTDALGNLIGRKSGGGGDAARSINAVRSVMLAAHMDEIGLIVTKLDQGFIRFTKVGGIDARTLPGQEVLVHGRQELPGMIASRPPHVLPAEEREKVLQPDQLFIDVGLAAEELDGQVRVGDLITIRRQVTPLQGDYLSGKAFDDRACVTAMLLAMDLLRRMEHAWDVYAVATVQEEVGLQGAITSTFHLAPTIGIALDVTFGAVGSPGEPEMLEMNKGPAVSFGPNIHPMIFRRLKEVCRQNEIPFQVEPIPGMSGTDAIAMQVTQSGLPTGLVGIPLRYMHSSVETVNLRDVERTARLLALFIAGLDEAFLASLALD